MQQRFSATREPSIRIRSLHGSAFTPALNWIAALCLVFGAQPALAVAGTVGFATASDAKAQVEAMRLDMKSGQTFLWRPLLRGGNAVAALEYWKAPGKPAIHPSEAEYVVVIAGAGTMVSGGSMEDAKQTNDRLIEGRRITGGTTRVLHVGDIFLVPAGTPHWFGITGSRLVLLGTKIPQAQQ